MPIRRISLALGIALAAVAMLADRLGVGQPGFGERQALLLVAGLGLVVAAIAPGRRRQPSTQQDRSAFERLRRAYVATAVVSLNTLLLAVVLNLGLLIAFRVSDAAGWTTPEEATGGMVDALAILRLARLAATTDSVDEASPLDLSDTDLARIYPGRSRSEVARLLRETRGRRLGYTPFAQFAEQPYDGRYVRVSEHGFRHGREKGPWPMDPAAWNIWVFGGSTTFGYGLSDDETIPARLQEALAAALRDAPHPPVRVYNFGQAYYYSSQELALFYRLLIAEDARPAVAVFIDGINEHFAEPFYSAVLRQLVRSPYTAPYARVEPHALADGERIVTRYLANRRLIEAWCEDLGVLALFVWQPSPEWRYDQRYHLFATAADDAAAPAYGASPHYAAMEDAAMERRQRGGDDSFLDLAELQVGVEEPLYVDRLHYSADFARRIADRIAERLLTLIHPDRRSAP